MTSAQAPVTGWTARDLAVIEDARVSLQKRSRNSALVSIAGVVFTVASFALMGGGGIVFFGAIIAGTGYAIDANLKLKKLDKLQPGTPLNAGTLGIRTSIDPPHQNNRTAVIVLGAIIGVLFVGIVGALVLG